MRVECHVSLTDAPKHREVHGHSRAQPAEVSERRAMAVDQMSDGVQPTPLLRRDPPAFGDIELIGRLQSHDAGMTYAAHLNGDNVTIVMLSEGADSDSYARARFREATEALDGDRPGLIVDREEEVDFAPWVAVASTSW